MKCKYWSEKHQECLAVDTTYEQGYNQALDDLSKGIKEILEDNAIYNIDCISTLVNKLKSEVE